MIKEYIEYLKYNREGYWFKNKMYGWGWVPATWQGWSIIAVWFVFFFLLVNKLKHNSLELSISVFFSLILLFIVCYKKGEKPRWQWGRKNKDLYD